MDSQYENIDISAVIRWIYVVFAAPLLCYTGHSESQSKSNMCWYLALKSSTEQRVSPQAGCSSTTCSS